MKIIIPMAGRGSRLRPHTLTTPKPLIPIAGKPMVQRLVEGLTAGLDEAVEDIAFVIGDFGKEVEKQLLAVAESLGAKGHIFYQDKPLGTAHAILCAKELLDGRCIVAFSDTLFRASFSFDPLQDGYIWVQKVEDPSSFGVVTVDDNNSITGFVEKSPVFVSDMAIVGIYYFREAQQLRDQLQYLLDNDIKDKGEYQLTSGLEALRSKGWEFKPAFIEEWLDCGNKDSVLHTNQRFLEFLEEELVRPSVQLENSVVIPPCFIGKDCILKNSVVGPYVSIGDNSTINCSVIERTLIQDHSDVNHSVLRNSMLGSRVTLSGTPKELSIGDYSQGNS
ncbi:MAG: NTP transferase domain-containing protein [Saprospiraceae bacterium]|nr:NTP transferase domain-containing protein [Saprospiraceae bacterium]